MNRNVKEAWKGRKTFARTRLLEKGGRKKDQNLAKAVLSLFKPKLEFFFVVVGRTLGCAEVLNK